jgi:hypothetical protein
MRTALERKRATKTTLWWWGQGGGRALRKQTLGREEKISKIDIFNILKKIRGDTASQNQEQDAILGEHLENKKGWGIKSMRA